MILVVPSGFKTGNDKDGLLAINTARGLASPVLISSVIDLASPQLNSCYGSGFPLWRLCCGISFAFLSLSLLSFEMFFFSHDFWEGYLQMPPDAWFSILCKLCSSKESKAAILSVLILNSCWDTLGIAVVSCVPTEHQACMWSCLLIISISCWTYPYSMLNCSVCLQTDQWMQEN